MDNMISGVIGVAVFTAFVAGLADSIASVPFIIIVGIVLLMVFSDLRQSIKAGFAEERAKKAGK